MVLTKAPVRANHQELCHEYENYLTSLKKKVFRTYSADLRALWLEWKETQQFLLQQHIQEHKKKTKKQSKYVKHVLSSS